MAQVKSVRVIPSISGQIDGQRLWSNLSAGAKRMGSAWTSPTGQGNIGRSFQLEQMTRKFLAERYPAKEGQDGTSLASNVSFGISGETYTFRILNYKMPAVERDKIFDEIRRLVLKPNTHKIEGV